MKYISDGRCPECPWGKNGPHSSKWPGYVRAMEQRGVGDGLHGCHMRTKNTWDYEKENVCHGALENKKREDAQRR